MMKFLSGPLIESVFNKDDDVLFNKGSTTGVFLRILWNFWNISYLIEYLLVTAT